MHSSQIGAGIQIPPNSSRILKRWNLLAKCQAVSIQPTEFILRSYRSGHILSRADQSLYTTEEYGAPYLHIHRADYHRILVEEAERLGVTILLNSAATGIDFETPAVHLKHRPDFPADLILGADGLKSVCREALLGRPDPPHLTGDLAYRLLIKASDMEKEPALRELASGSAINIWVGPDAHVVGYFLQEGGLYNMVLSCRDNLPELVNSAKADLTEMREAFRGWDPKLGMLLGLVRESTKWRLLNSWEMERWSHPGGKFALLGDACHATLPYLYVASSFPPSFSQSYRIVSAPARAFICRPINPLSKPRLRFSPTHRAQGAALALEDGALLGHLFSRPLSPTATATATATPSLLTLYETLRKPRATRIVQLSTAIGAMLHLRDGPAQQERDRRFRLEEQSGEKRGSENVWADDGYVEWVFGYDVLGLGDGEGVGKGDGKGVGKGEGVGEGEGEVVTGGIPT